MKSNLLIPRCLALGLASVAGLGQSVSEDPAAASSGEALGGPHHQVVEWTTETLDAQGQPTIATNRYTEIATGLNWWNSATGQWEPTVPDFEVTPDGYALAVRGQHKVILNLNNLNAGGSVDLELPGGQERLRSNPMGLAFYDEATGKNVLIAEVKDCAGELLAPGMIGYADAFDSIQAAVRYNYTRAGFEQDVLIYGPGTASLDPAEYGLNPATTRLEMYSEFFDPPEPQVVTRQIAEGLEDQELNFGTMQLADGTAYVLGESLESVPVVKSWARVKDPSVGERVFLIESVPFEQVRPLFERSGVALRGPEKPDATLLAQRLTRGREAQLARLSPRTASPAVLVAKAEPKAWQTAGGVALDWTSVNTSQTNFVFKGDETYYVSGFCYLYGSTTIEGGTVVKYTNSASLRFLGAVDCQTSAFRPAVFTSKDDDSLGQVIPGSTGNPGGTYATYAFQFYLPPGPLDVHHVRVAYANYGMLFYGQTGHRVRHCQFVRCNTPIYTYSSSAQTLALQNVLFHRVGTYAMYLVGTSPTVTGEHLTLHEVNQVVYPANKLWLTNSLLVGITNWSYAFSGSNNATNSESFQAVGAGEHYLASTSTNRNAGTTNINATLLAELRNLTTYPPIVLTNDFTTSTTLSPQAQRDTDSLDLGWHYDPLDYCWSGLNLTNATLTLTNGVAVGLYGASGTQLRAGAQFISQGTPVRLNRLVRYEAVQEQSYAWGAAPVEVFNNSATASYPQVRLAFTDISVMANSSSRRNLLSSNTALNPLAISHSQLRGLYQYQNDSSHSTYQSLNWTNNLFERCTLDLQHYGYYAPFSLAFYNNLFAKGTLAFNTPSSGYSLSWTIKDCLFDSDNLSHSGSARINNSNNGYRSGLSTLQGGYYNKVGLTLDFQSGAATNWYGVRGSFYYPTSGGSTNLYALLNAGSRNATTAGLYHFTVRTDQAKETNSVVDIGYHYTAAGTNGLPADVDGDGLADYFEDRNGNGVYDGASGETDWQTSNSGLSGPAALQLFTPLK